MIKNPCGTFSDVRKRSIEPVFVHQYSETHFERKPSCFKKQSKADNIALDIAMLYFWKSCEKKLLSKKPFKFMCNCLHVYNFYLFKKQF